MIIKQLKDEDFLNYKKPSMFIGFPHCSFKCEKECGKKMCQNSELASSQDMDVSSVGIVKRYLLNDMTNAVVIGGLEPFDDFESLVILVSEFRKHTNDDIVIYTGFYQYEISEKIEFLKQNYNNLIVKYGRYIPDKQSRYDETLGVILASDNQYAERIC